MTISERVTTAESEIRGIKTRQETQNDSYKFYRYRSQNLFSSSDHTYSIRFIPTAKASEQVICNFNIMNYTFPALTSSVISAKPENPLEADLEIVSLSGLDWSDFQKRIYVTCISNCEGTLIVTQLT